MTLPPGLCEVWDPAWSCRLPTSSIPVTGDAAEIATEVLYGLSGRQFGLCERTVRPCRASCYDGTWGSIGVDSGMYPQPALLHGQWYNLTCGSCSGDCSCTEISEVALPGPVHDVTEVKIDGVVLNPALYRLDDWRLLVLLNDTWPTCNDLNLDDDQIGTWSVTFRTGVPVPMLGQLAVAELAMEIAKFLSCDSSCMLPMPMQSIVRQGLNITLLDPNKVFAGGKLGLYFSDLFLQTYNPSRLRRRSRAYDIDALATRRHVGS